MGFGSLCITCMRTCILQAVSYQFYACMMHANQISFLYNRCRVDYVKLLYADYSYFAACQMTGPVSPPSKSSKGVNNLLHTLRCGSTLPRKHLLVADRPTVANISGAHSMLNVAPDLERLHFPLHNCPDDHYRTLRYMVCSPIICRPGLSVLM